MSFQGTGESAVSPDFLEPQLGVFPDVTTDAPEELLLLVYLRTHYSEILFRHLERVINKVLSLFLEVCVEYHFIEMRGFFFENLGFMGGGEAYLK